MIVLKMLKVLIITEFVVVEVVVVVVVVVVVELIGMVNVEEQFWVFNATELIFAVYSH